MPETLEQNRQKHLDMLAEGVQTLHPEDILNWITMAIKYGVPVEKIHVRQTEEDGLERELIITEATDEEQGLLETAGHRESNRNISVIGQDLFVSSSKPELGKTVYLKIQDANNFHPKMVKIDT